MTVKGRGNFPRPYFNHSIAACFGALASVSFRSRPGATASLPHHEEKGEMHAQEWKPPAEFDAKIREWMAGHGWTANSTRDYFNEEVYAWREDMSSGSSPTLWIARSVIDNYPVGKVVEQLDELGVAERMRRSPKARFKVTQEAGMLVVRSWPRSE